MASGAERGYTLRSTGSIVTFWVGVAILVFIVVTPIVIGDWRTLGWIVAPALLLAWALWILLYRPVVRYDSTRAVVVNVGRIHVLPWPRVQAVVQRLNLAFHLEDGSTVNAWGAPYPRKHGNLASLLDRGSRTAYDFDKNSHLLEGFRHGAAPTDAPVEHRSDVVPLAIGAVLVVVVVVEIATGL